MKKKIKVTHTHRYTLENALLYEGYALYNDFNTYKEYIYQENEETKVILYIYDTHMEIQRYGEAQSSLTLKKDKTTLNPIKSMYGTFEVEIKTYDYQVNEKYMMVEYDVENGSQDKDGFKIEIVVEEDGHEFH